APRRPGCDGPPVVGRRRGRGGARWCAAVVCARLLRTRQRVLRPLGRDQPRSRYVHRVDASARAAGSRRMSKNSSGVGSTEPAYNSDEMMAIEAWRRLTSKNVCFVGIGLPSVAANLARRTHAPGCVLVYESGTIGAKPTRLPLSIGDGELAETADVVVSVPEMFAYWLQSGRI